MSQIDNIFIQVRARLQELSIKLWLEPYYFSDIGSIEAEIDILAADFSRNLGITQSKCKIALMELQDGALRKLAARKEFADTGVATFGLRLVKNTQGTQNLSEVKCPISALGSKLMELVVDKLQLPENSHVKLISGGKMILPTKTLEAQGLKNNSQLMVITSTVDQRNSSEMYDRIRKIRMDVEAIADSKRQLFEMEDQDGNPVFLPPEENRAILIALGLYEKARAAMKRDEYDEALVLLLEADEQFSICNSKFLDAVDNYALLNLDIVWCYMCLKNFNQLPDAERRLKICEDSFRRSYGENMSRLIALKGSACPERALLMRLHLLQGVLLFHNNRRNEAFEKFELAASELQTLKVDDITLISLIEMGYEPFEARLGLRASAGNVELAINNIHERREKLEKTRQRSKAEREMREKMKEFDSDKDGEWVNPRSVCTLTEMGFEPALVVQALKITKNNVPKALDILQNNAEELRRNVPPHIDADEKLLQMLKAFGFNESLSRYALESSKNNIDASIEYLLKMFENESDLKKAMERVLAVVQTHSPAHSQATTSTDATAGPSTSTAIRASPSIATLLRNVLSKFKSDMDSLKAYDRFNKDISQNDDEYLDLALVQEEEILLEYKRLLES